MTLSQGDKLGPYLILSALGAGGMGEVWRARDTRLDRIVAIKQLKGQHSARFQQEARSIAALNHPHICQIYDVGPDYLVMECVEGKPLSGPLPVEEAVKFAIQIASALEDAHAKGILHRDLKPANILVTSKGSTKLLDFGLAKLMSDTDADATQTVEGTVLGSPAYMSPEQAQGKTLDERSDIFSFGAVLYELLSGKRPFGGSSIVEVLSSVLRDEPARIDAPESVAAIVRRCMAKRAGDRFGSMRELLKALQQSASKSDAQASIAVLPFANMSRDADDEYFSDGLAEEIINALVKVPGLKVIARTSAFAFKGQNTDIRKIAETLGVTTVLEGSVRRSGNRIRVTAQLITATDGSHLWSERYDREMADVFAVQDEISAAITGALRVKLSGEATPQRYMPPMPAYEQYLKAKYLQAAVTPESLELARRCYESAIEIDPAFALAYVGLGYYWVGFALFGRCPAHQAVPSARAEVQRALRIDPSLPEAHALLGYLAALYDLDWAAAERHFSFPMAKQAGFALIRPVYGAFQFLRGNVEQAIELAQRAIEEDPLDVWPRMNLHAYLQAAGRDDEALQQLSKVLELDETQVLARVSMAMIYADRGQLPEALQAARRAYAIGPWLTDAIGVLAGLLRRNGQEAESQALAQSLGSGEAPGEARARALFHLLTGGVDRGADWAEKAIEQRDNSMMYYVRFVVCKELRASHRWQKIGEMLNLPAAQLVSDDHRP